MEAPKKRGRHRTSSHNSESELNTNNEVSSLEQAPNLNGEKVDCNEKDIIENQNNENGTESREASPTEIKEEVKLEVDDIDEQPPESQEEANRVLDLEVKEETEVSLEDDSMDSTQNPTENTTDVSDQVQSDVINESTKDAKDLAPEKHISQALAEAADDVAAINVGDVENNAMDVTESIRVDSDKDNSEIIKDKVDIINPKERLPRGRKRKVSEVKIVETNKNMEDPLQSVIKDEPIDLDMYPVSSEILGKGKRARIPNKRYSDILISPTNSKKSGSTPLENGNAEKLDSGNDTDSSLKEEFSGFSPSQRSASPFLRKVKAITDLSDPKYLKPFKFGWRRELVYRAIFDPVKGAMGDIYYYTPEGKKVRSRREVAENLKNKELSIENFSFFKDAIGLDDPEKEIIRDAKVSKSNDSLVKQVTTKSLKSSSSSSSSPRSPKLSSPKLVSPKLDYPKPSTSKVVSPKLTPAKISSPKPVVSKIRSPQLSSSKLPASKLVSPKLSSSKLPASKLVSPKLSSSKLPASKLVSPKLASPKVSSPQVPTARLGRPPGSGKKARLNETADSPPKNRSLRTTTKDVKFQMKTPIKKEIKDIKKPIDKPVVEKMEVDQTPPVKTPGRRGRKPSYEEEPSDIGSDIVPAKPCEPCSIRCKGVLGIVPTLQCRICLCLYHHECVGLSPVHTSLPYVCKNCHLEGQDQTPDQPTAILSALPPLTPINVLKPTGSQITTLPKLQRIPKPTHPEGSLEPDPLPEPPVLTPRPQPEEAKSLVGSLTTWLPHNSKIIDNIQEVAELPIGSAGVPRPQYVEILAGRKFLVIPKHNFMSVSPSVAASAVTRVVEGQPKVDSVSLGFDPGSEIKVEPDSPAKPENAQTPEAMEVESCADDSAPMAETAEDDSGQSEQVAVQKPPSPPPASVQPTTPSAASAKSSTKKRTIKLSSITNAEEKEDNRFMDNYLQNLAYGYNTLLYIFQYLKVQDLLRAGCVCTMWRDIASHTMLWRTVRMKNSQVHSFEGLANSLKKYGTKHLDLRKMLLPNGGDEIWPEFSKAIAKVETLRRIELCRCPAAVVENLAVSNPHLEVINAVTIKCEQMNLDPLKSLTEIKELRLKSTGGLTLTSSLDSLKEMKVLKQLSLTSIKDLDHINLEVIGELTNLESLDLGECTDFPKNFGEEILLKLKNLERLRLEKGQGNCHTFEILEAVRQMNRLEQLELVNFDIKTGFDKALGACQNIKKLLIIPTYISQSATTNHMVLGGVLRLQKTLSHFVWGVTLELLRVTELFVDQCEEPKDKKEKKQAGNGDCIPVLKPVPLLLDKDSEIAPALDPPQVEILALPSLQKLLMQNLPTTRVKILKIPFHATWRQSLTDSVN